MELEKTNITYKYIYKGEILDLSALIVKLSIVKVLQSLVDVSAENEFPESEECDNDIMEKKGAKRKRFFALKTSKTEALIRELNSRFGIQDNMTSTPLSSKI